MLFSSLLSPRPQQAAICFFNDHSFPPLKPTRWAQCRSAWGYCVPFFSSRPSLPRKLRQPTLLSPLATPHNATTLRFPGLVNILCTPLDYSRAWLQLMFYSRRNCAVYSDTHSCMCLNASVTHCTLPLTCLTTYRCLGHPGFLISPTRALAMERGRFLHNSRSQRDNSSWQPCQMPVDLGQVERQIF